MKNTRNERRNATTANAQQYRLSPGRASDQTHEMTTELYACQQDSGKQPRSQRKSRRPIGKEPSTIAGKVTRSPSTPSRSTTNPRTCSADSRLGNTRRAAGTPPRLTAANVYLQHVAEELAAVRTPVGQPLVFCDACRTGGDFHLLEHFRLAPSKNQCATAVRATVERVGQELVDRLRRKRGPQVLVMSRLSAAFPFLATHQSRFLRFDDVTRRWLRGGGGVLLQLSVFRSKSLHLGHQFGNPLIYHDTLLDVAMMPAR
jgi:hypothetical protein